MTMHKSLPEKFHRYFWGDNLTDLNWQEHQKYITQTLLEKGDIDAVSWLLQTVEKSQLLNQLPELKLSAKSSNFWKIYLS